MIAARVMAVAALVVAFAGSAEARKKKPKAPAGMKVHIETDPAGADVYLGDKEAGSAGQTPLDLTLAPGEYVVILELDGHVPKFETIVVEAKKGKAAKTAQPFSFTLDPSTATLVVNADGELPEGASVVIDGEDYGEPPVTMSVDAGAHQVQLIAPGRDPYEEWVEVEGGGEHVVTVSASSLGTVEDEVAPVVKPSTKKPARGPIGTVRSGIEVGWRRYRYDAPRTPNLRPYDAAGSVLILIDAELHPWRYFSPHKILDRLMITGGAGLAPTITVRGMGETLAGYWRAQHAGVRGRVYAAKQLAADVDLGWMHLLYTFRDENNLPVDEVPDVDYHMLRIGGRLVYHHAPQPIDAWLGLDQKIVLSGGPLEDRFRAADVNGFGIRAGVAAWFFDRHLEGRVEGNLTRFGWTFQSEDGDAFDADGGSDLLYGVTLSVGGAY